MSIPRNAARALLEKLPEHGNDVTGKENKFEVTICSLQEGADGSTVVRLVKDTFPSKTDGSIYSIAILFDGDDGGAPSVTAAHETDLVQASEIVKKHQFDSNICCDSIRPNPKLVGDDGAVAKGSATDARALRMKDLSERREKNGLSAYQKKTQQGGGGGARSNSSPPKKATGTTKGKTKNTIASSFFAAASKQSKTAKSSASASSRNAVVKKTVASTKSEDEEDAEFESPVKEKKRENTKKNKNSNNDAQPPSKRAKKHVTDAEPMETESSPPTRTKKHDTDTEPMQTDTKPRTRTKRKNPNSQPPPPPKGNADDFVGDIDEDEDDIVQDKERRKRIALEERRKIRADATSNSKPTSASVTRQTLVETAQPQKNHSDDEDEPVSGAMDSFVKHGEKTRDENEPPQRIGRRRKIVDKMFVDESGYLVTEKVTEWEEIDLEEERRMKEKQNRVKAKQNVVRKSKNTQGMKQMGLKGFFKKKK